jgi:hypothetical protein
MFDFESLTGREASLIEELSGLSIDSIGNEGAPKAKLLGAIIMIAKRREGDKKFTFNEAMDMPISQMTAYLGLNEEESDEEGEDERSDVSATE